MIYIYTYIKVGVVSWGIGCGTTPGVYADLSILESWIQVTNLLELRPFYPGVIDSGDNSPGVRTFLSWSN